MSTKESLIPNDTLPFILGDGYQSLPLYLENCFCLTCSDHTTTIVDYKVYVNGLNDIILKGKCKTCLNPVNRYLETGEHPEAVSVIKHLKSELKKKKKE